MNPEQGTAPYADALLAYSKGSNVRAAIPGHLGRWPSPRFAELFSDYYARDWRGQVPGLDAPEGTEEPALYAAQRLAAELWGAAECVFMTGGASSAVQAMTLAVSQTAGETTWLVQSSSHKSVANAARWCGAKIKLLVPERHQLGFYAAVTPEALRNALETTSNVGAVILTTPSNEGITGDVRSLARIAHDAGAILAVDGAWGTEHGLHPALPPCSLAEGADILTLSAHKSIGSPGQTALVLRSEESMIPSDVFWAGALQVISTSKSTVLLAGLDLARHRMATDGAALIEDTLGAIESASSELQDAGLARLDVAELIRNGACGARGWNPMRVVIPTLQTGHTGYAIGHRLRERFGIELWQLTPYNVVASFGVGAEPRMIEAVFRSIATTVQEPPALEPLRLGTFPAPPTEDGEIDMSGLLRIPTETVPVEGAMGRRSAATLISYPPGAPVLWPGTHITEERLHYLQAIRDAGGHVYGGDRTLSTFLVYRR